MLAISQEELPTRIIADDLEIPVSADFRSWIKADLIMKDRQIPKEAKLPVICQYIGLDLSRLDVTIPDLWAGIFKFYMCEQEPKGESVNSSKATAYRFDCDWWLIYAAFIQQYGINLLRADLHWFEFRALLDGLTEQTQFIKVVQARLRDTSKLKGEEKAQAEKLKRYWKVPDDSAQEERDPHEIEAELLAKLNT
jgi:hypothetical protein|nr:MAG TPA: hypothetical protein [Caudoviricetes sp.]